MLGGDLVPMTPQTLFGASCCGLNAQAYRLFPARQFRASSPRVTDERFHVLRVPPSRALFLCVLCVHILLYTVVRP